MPTTQGEVGVTWHLRAACRDRSDITWVQDTRDDANLARAKAICATCPVSRECLDEAMSQAPNRYHDAGIRAGTTPKERDRLRRERKAN